MKVWTNNQFTGHYPVGTAAVVVANTAKEASVLLNHSLAKNGLPQSAAPEQFENLPTSTKRVVILCDGNY